MKLMTAEEKREQIRNWLIERKIHEESKKHSKDQEQLEEIAKRIENSTSPECLVLDYAISAENEKKLEEAGYDVDTKIYSAVEKYTFIKWGQKPNLLKKIKEAWIRLIIKL